jgi:hypothetical protein
MTCFQTRENVFSRSCRCGSSHPTSEKTLSWTSMLSTAQQNNATNKRHASDCHDIKAFPRLNQCCLPYQVSALECGWRLKAHISFSITIALCRPEFCLRGNISSRSILDMPQAISMPEPVPFEDPDFPRSSLHPRF